MEPNNVLLELRQEAGLTQAELAERMGWTQGFVSQLETGERGIAPHVLRLKDELKSQMKRRGYDVEDLLRGKKRRRRAA